VRRESRRRNRQPVQLLKPKHKEGPAGRYAPRMALPRVANRSVERRANGTPRVAQTDENGLGGRKRE